ncbi:hypothetical protein ILUMI_06198 [Ignelater luminosus]|uniref:Single domain-containing protein n=1 Tax=Ignelater luminosus TaxID=2038154 RepID=A0A8K0D5R0_IGNLU|nr:hypothetical protein ILUMI_06198 [Ignelater luminosus]
MLNHFLFIFAVLVSNKIVLSGPLRLYEEDIAPRMPSFQDDSETRYCHRNGVYFKEATWIPAPIGQCAKLYCRYGGRNIIEISGCDTLPCPPHCHQTREDLTKFFPACCPRNICKTTEIAPICIDSHL